MSPPVAVDNDSNNVGSVAATGPLTVDAIPALRAKSAKIPTGVAPATNSDMFKSPVCYLLAFTNRQYFVAKDRLTLLFFHLALLHQASIETLGS